MKMIMMAILMTQFLSSNLAFARAECRDRSGQLTLRIEQSKDAWNLSIRNGAGSIVLRDKVYPENIQVNGFCNQSFVTKLGYSWNTNYCKTIFNAVGVSPAGESARFFCHGTFVW